VINVSIFQFNRTAINAYNVYHKCIYKEALK